MHQAPVTVFVVLAISIHNHRSGRDLWRRSLAVSRRTSRLTPAGKWRAGPLDARRSTVTVEETFTTESRQQTGARATAF